MGHTGFVVIGADHPHAIVLTAALIEAGAAPLGWVDPSGGGTAMGFGALFPDIAELDLDAAFAIGAPLIVIAAIPRERADLAERALRTGADVLVAKPAAISLDQLARIETAAADTGRRWWVGFTEYIGSRAVVAADRVVASGRVGEVRHVLGLGPHRLGEGRPGWFHDPAAGGALLADLASHQIHHAIRLLGSRDLRVVAARTTAADDGRHPDQLGELLLEGGTGSAYFRVDWLTPDGLPTWGDVRLMITGTAGTIEIRANCDIGAADAAAGTTDHLLVVDADGTESIDCSSDTLRWAEELLADVEAGTETRLTTADCLAATRLAIEAAELAAS